MGIPLRFAIFVSSFIRPPHRGPSLRSGRQRFWITYGYKWHKGPGDDAEEDFGFIACCVQDDIGFFSNRLGQVVDPPFGVVAPVGDGELGSFVQHG